MAAKSEGEHAEAHIKKETGVMKLSPALSKAPGRGSGLEGETGVAGGAAGPSSPSASLPHNSSTSKEDLRVLAQKLAALPLPASRPDLWGVLTAISEKARARPQGSHILLHSSEHLLGRAVRELSCQFESPNVSARHCTINRIKVNIEEGAVSVQSGDRVLGDQWLTVIKDFSSNGTFINWQKLKRESPEVHIQHGDIISLVNVPEHENAFAFVFREVASNMKQPSSHVPNGGAINILKRKKSPEEDHFGEGLSGDMKRVRGLGIGGPDGPVSLDDVRRLQRSNEELRQQLEAHVLTIEKLRSEARTTAARHDAEVKELRESISVAFRDQIKDLRHELIRKEKELEDFAAVSAQQQGTIEDLNRHLAAAAQSRTDAEVVIKSQKVTITELKEQLEEERNQRRDEREKAEADLKAAVERTRLEAVEELKRQSEAATRQHKEQLDVINKLQEADKENHLLNETLHSKLDDLRGNLVKAEKKTRSLEVQLHEEELSSAAARKKTAEKEQELEQAYKDLGNEKGAREDAWAKVSSLELEMESAIRDLALEKQRLQGARERIVLRETQLRAFHSTAEEIAALQQKQQEQLKAMLRTLEDEDDEVHADTRHQDDDDVRIGLVKDGGLNVEAREAGGAKVDSCGNCHGLNEQVTGGSNNAVATKRGSEKADGTDDESKKSTARNDHKDDNLNRNSNKDWVDGDTQDDDCALLAPLPDAPEDAENKEISMADEQMGAQKLLGTAIEAEYTQLLETETNTVWKSGSMAADMDLGETEALANLAASMNAPRISLVESAHEHDGMVENERGEDEDAGGLEGETMQLEDDEQETMEWGRTEMAVENQGATVGVDHEDDHQLAKLHVPPGHQSQMSRTSCQREDHGIPGGRIRGDSESIGRRDATMTTLDLLTSEVAGSWAISTPASVHGDNESSESEERNDERVEESDRGNNAAHADFDSSQVGIAERVPQHGAAANMRRSAEVLVSPPGSQNSLSPRTAAWHDRERQALNEMIDIVAPDFSRLHGIGRGLGTAPDSEEHTEEEDGNKEEDYESEGDSTGSEPVSQSPSVSAR